MHGSMLRFLQCVFLFDVTGGEGQYSQGGVVDEVFEVDAAAVLCKVSETAVTHWNNKWETN